MNKKGLIGEADKLLYWLLIVVPTIALVVVIVIAWSTGLKNVYFPQNLEPLVYESRLLYSPNCFAYKDPVTGRVFTGTVDPGKFNAQTLHECVPLKGAMNHAFLVELSIGDDVSIPLETENWRLKPQQDILVNSYVVYVQGNGPGLLTFRHKS